MAGFGNIVSAILKDKGIMQKTLAVMVGSRPSVIGQALKIGTVNLKTAVKVLDALGYELIVQKKHPGKKLPGELNVTIGEIDQKEADKLILPKIQYMEGKTGQYYKVRFIGDRLVSTEIINETPNRTIWAESKGETTFVYIPQHQADDDKQAKRIARAYMGNIETINTGCSN